MNIYYSARKAVLQEKDERTVTGGVVLSFGLAVPSAPVNWLSLLLYKPVSES